MSKIVLGSERSSTKFVKDNDNITGGTRCASDNGYLDIVEVDEKWNC